MNTSSPINTISSVRISHMMESSRPVLHSEYRSYQRSKFIHPIPEYPNTNTPSVFVKPSIFFKKSVVTVIFPLGKPLEDTKFVHDNSTLTFPCRYVKICVDNWLSSNQSDGYPLIQAEVIE